MGMHSTVATNHYRMVTQSAAYFLVGGSNPRWLTVIGGAAAMFARPGLELATKKPAVGCITVRPLLILG